MNLRRTPAALAFVACGALVAAACTSATPSSGGASSGTTEPGATASGTGSTQNVPSTTSAPARSDPQPVIEPSSSAGPAPVTSAPASSGAARTCGAAPQRYPAGTSTQELTVDGTPRSFLVHVPASLPDAPALVVDFHGAGSNKEEQSFYSGFDPLADREGFVVATPDAQDGPVRQWDLLAPADLDFARALVAELSDALCIDPAKVYATGISSGAAMSARLACQAADVFSGFGLVAADFYLPELCAAAPPRPIIAFHGTADPVVPFAGGPVAVAGGLVVAPARQTIAEWAGHNGCSASPAEEALGEDVVRLQWSGCSAPVTFYEITGGGHVWPGAAIDVPGLGYTTRTIDASELIWEALAG